MSTDKLAAYQTLYTCLKTVAQLMAPIAPFYTDQLYRDLNGDSEASVHTSDFPVADDKLIDAALEERMNLAQTITSMVLALRRNANLKVRQPLTTLMVPVLDAHQREAIEAVADLIKNEVNVKELRLVDDASGILVKSVKPNFKVLGKKLGKQMKSVASQLQTLTQEQIKQLEMTGELALDVDGAAVTVERDDVEIISQDIPGWQVANEGNVTVALDITLTDELRREGLARDLVNRIQNIRKSRNYDITDRINIVFEPSPEVSAAVDDFRDYIMSQVLASALTVAPVADPAEDEKLDIDGLNVNIKITKA